MKVLVVEEDPKTAQFIKQGLEEQSYEAHIAYDGRTAKSMVLSAGYDVMITEINIPYINGLELVRQLRDAHIMIPVLVISALSGTEDKILAFNSGVDQFLPKPFDFRELLARLRSLIRRGRDMANGNNLLRTADLELDLDAKSVRRAGRNIELTTREFALLEFLMRNKGRTVSRVDISEKVWEIKFDTGTNLIDVYVNYLRRKIDKEHPVKLIHTVVGMGYLMKEK